MVGGAGPPIQRGPPTPARGRRVHGANVGRSGLRSPHVAPLDAVYRVQRVLTLSALAGDSRRGLGARGAAPLSRCVLVDVLSGRFFAPCRVGRLGDVEGGDDQVDAGVDGSWGRRGAVVAVSPPSHARVREGPPPLPPARRLVVRRARLPAPRGGEGSRLQLEARRFLRAPVHLLFKLGAQMLSLKVLVLSQTHGQVPPADDEHASRAVGSLRNSLPYRVKLVRGHGARAAGLRAVGCLSGHALAGSTVVAF